MTTQMVNAVILTVAGATVTFFESVNYYCIYLAQRTSEASLKRNDL